MASINNWLAFSLSPQELQSQHHQTPRLGFNSDDISGTGDCFDLTSDSSSAAPFTVLEAFNPNTQSQDWNMKGALDGNYKSSSELSMLMGSSCNQEPKLENFLGNHNTTAGDYTFLNRPPKATSTNGRATNEEDSSNSTVNNCNTNIETGNSGNSSIGLSMIKTWLRNQPAPAQPVEGKTNGGASQSLSLSMSTGGGDSSSSNNNKQQKTSSTGLDSQSGAIEAAPRKSIDTFGQRTSIYRGVTRHRWTGRYEAHLWDNSCRREGQTRKGRQVYLGGYDKEEKAARAYDLAALKYWGSTTTTNFPISNYEKELEEMKHMTRQEYVASLRRKSSGFSRGASIYRGVTRHHQHGRWQARIGRVAGNKDLYLGTFSTQEEAAEAYDIAAIKFRGLNAVTNFDMSRYDVKSILESSTLPIGGAAKRLKDVEQVEMAINGVRADEHSLSSQLTDIGATHPGWPGAIAFQQAQPFAMHYPYGQRVWCKQEQDSDTNNHTFNDLHQLQLGSTHNFFQPNVLHNLMSMDSASMEHSSGSNSVIYSNGGDSQGGVGYGGNGGGYAIPLNTVVANDSNQNHGNGYENIYGSADSYNSKSFYCLSQQSLSNSWVPTAVPTIAQRSSNMAVCHGASTFTVWNDM